MNFTVKTKKSIHKCKKKPPAALNYLVFTFLYGKNRAIRRGFFLGFFFSRYVKIFIKNTGLAGACCYTGCFTAAAGVFSPIFRPGVAGRSVVCSYVLSARGIVRDASGPWCRDEELQVGRESFRLGARLLGGGCGSGRRLHGATRLRLHSFRPCVSKIHPNRKNPSRKSKLGSMGKSINNFL